MSAAELIRLLAARLQSAGIPFMVIGSIAASFYGAGRSTMDIDLVIDATSHQLSLLVDSLAAPNIYVSADAAAEALEHEPMFNVVDAATGWKADLIICKSRAFSRQEFARRRPFDFENTHLWVATLEDLIVAKLEWAKLGASARQIDDVAAMLRVAGADVDHAYLERWIVELDLDTEWQAARRLTPPLHVR